jgi:hypothetical protein
MYGAHPNSSQAPHQAKTALYILDRFHYNKNVFTNGKERKKKNINNNNSNNNTRMQS